VEFLQKQTVRATQEHFNIRMTKKIIKLEPVVDCFTVNWFLGLRCNFDCMYCPDMFHNLTDPDMPLEKLKKDWLRIVDKTHHLDLPYKITFTGGEVTINKDFLPFLKWLDSEYGDQIVECGFTSNGSAPLRVYQEALRLGIISFISLSTHSEFMNERKFFTNVTELDKIAKELDKSLHVNIMNEPWNKDRIEKYTEYLDKQGISSTVNRIIWTHQIRQEPLPNPSKQEFNFDNKG